MGDRPLPSRPSLSSLKKQAKQLLRLQRARDPEALERFARSHPRSPAAPSLRDAQLVVAREYGFRRWSELKAHTEDALVASLDLAGQIDTFLDLACLAYTPADGPGRRRRAERLLAIAPEMTRASLAVASVVGDVESARQLLGADPSLASRRGGPRGWDPLLYLCYGRVGGSGPGRDPLAVARLLLEHGADASTHVILDDHYRFTALTGAIGEGERGPRFQPPHPQAPALARLLLDAGADPNDSQALYNTMFRPSNQWLELLLQYGLDASRQVNWSPRGIGTLDYLLGCAVRSGLRERVALLLEHGASASGREWYNHRTHHENALLGGFSEIAALLERHGATPAELSGEEQFRAVCMRGDAGAAAAMLAEHPAYHDDPHPLLDASDQGRLDVVELLLEIGFSPAARSADGTSALHNAALKGHAGVVRALVEAGAPVDALDAVHHATPLGWATFGASAGWGERGRPQEVIDYLLERTNSALDLARHGRIDRLTALLEREPGLARAGNPAGGDTPLHAVRDETPNLDAVIELLLRHGADPGARNRAGRDVLEHLDAEGAAAAAAALRRLSRRRT